jgi:hypothetical protein
MGKVKKFICLLTVTCLSTSVYANTLSCAYRLQVENSKSYAIEDYANFITTEFRPKLSKKESQFNVVLSRSCPSVDDQSIHLKVDAQTYILKSINEKEINIDLKRYNPSNLILDKNQLDRSFDTALHEDFSKMKNEQLKQDTLKFLGFILSDAARFDDIRIVSDKMLNKGCEYPYDAYRPLARSWRKVSEYLFFQQIKIENAYQGGANCSDYSRYCLTAPISHTIAEQFLSSKDNEDQVLLPKDQCSH